MAVNKPDTLAEYMEARSRLRALSSTIVKKCKRPAPQCLLLLAIKHHPLSDQTALVKRTGIDRSTLSVTLEHLIRDGLVMKKHSEDNDKSYQVSLTRSGIIKANKIGWQLDCVCFNNN